MGQPVKMICIGACAGAFGVKGEIKIKSFTAIPEDIFSYGPFRNEGGAVILTADAYRTVKGGFAAKCQQVQTREQAQALSGTKLYVFRDALPEPEEDEFYFEDLIGLSVKTVDGRRVGTVKAVQNFGAGDMLEIAGGRDKKGQPLGDFYHPFTQQAVPIVDIQGGRIVIAPVDSGPKTR